jgi:quercetin dioxygenase-like cupin family protein
MVSVIRGGEVETIVSPRPDQEGLRLRRLLQDESGTTSFVLGETEMPAGRCHEVHRHPNAEQAIYVLRGTVSLVRPHHEDVILRAGDVAHVPAGEWHGTANQSGATAATLTIFGGVARAADAGYEEYNVRAEA